MYYLLILIIAFSPSYIFSQFQISEVCASNAHSHYDDDMSTPDWIEIQNITEQSNLFSNYYISDKKDFNSASIIQDTLIDSGSHFLINASGKINNPEKIRLQGNGEGLFPHIHPDSYDVWYKDLEGDFSFEITIHSFKKAELFGNIGITAFETLDGTSDYVGFSAFTEERESGGIMFREGTKYSERQWLTRAPKFNQDLHIQLRREGNTFFADFKDDLGYIFHSDQKEIALNKSLKVGITLTSRHLDSTAIATISDVRINNQKFDFNALTHKSVNTIKEGGAYNNQEIHVDFSLKKGETVYLWKGEELVDSLHIIHDRPDITVVKDLPFSNDYSAGFPSPGATNFDSRIGIIDDLKIKGENFFKESTTIELESADGDAIYYTLDGSVPTSESLLYKEPFNINETTIVRAIATKVDYFPTEVDSETFFKNTEHDLPIISLIVDSTAMFGESGLENGWGSNQFIESNLELYIDYKKDVDQLVDITNHGHGPSRGIDPKSKRILSRGKFNESEIVTSVFGDEEVCDKLILRNSGQDLGGLFFRDGLANVFSERLNTVDVTRFEPAIYYVNGKYWGMLNVRDRLDEEFLSLKYNIKENSIDFIEDNFDLEYGNIGEYLDLINYAETASKKSDDFIAYIKNNVNYYSLLDYLFNTFYLINYDWPEHNQKFWKSSDLDDKWRFTITDFDWSMNLDWAARPDVNKFGDTFIFSDTSSRSFFAGFIFDILENQQIRFDFLNRSADLINTLYNSETLIHISDSLLSYMETDVNQLKERWPEILKNYEQQKSLLNKFFNERPTYYRQHLINHYNLPGEAELNLSTYPENAGTFDLNTISIDTSIWTGIYFQEVPVSVTAIPKHGFEFVKWSMEGLPEKSTITLELDDITNLEAIYQRVNLANKDTFLVINEIMYDADPDNDCEDWIEIYNAGQKNINLNGWTIIDEDPEHTAFVINEDLTLMPDEYLIITRDSTAFKEIYPEITNYIGDFDFGFGGNDIVKLITPDGNTHDSVNYDNDRPWPLGAEETGYTIELKNPHYDNNIGDNWELSLPTGGTPEEINSAFETVGVEEYISTELTVKDLEGFISISSEKPQSRLLVYDSIGRIITDKSVSSINSSFNKKDGVNLYIAVVIFKNGTTETIKIID